MILVRDILLEKT